MIPVRAHIPVSLHLFMAAPLLLAVGLALAAPGWRLTWLALGLLATLVLTLATMLWQRPAGRLAPVWPAVLLALAALASPLLPLMPGLLLLAAVRLGWAWRYAPLPGFPMVEAALLLAAALTVLPPP